MASSVIVSTPAALRSVVVRPRLRSQAPMSKNASTEASISSTCLNISSGVEVAATSSPSVVRKKDSSSISKPVRSISRIMI